jgi:hypothetical protein
LQLPPHGFLGIERTGAGSEGEGFPDTAVENRSKAGNCEHGKALVIDPAFEISGQLEGTTFPSLPQ